MKDWYKFRGWDATGQKGWVYGDLVHNQKVTKEGLEPRTMVGGYEVVPDSVGLFTGLQDMKGRFVHDGDIMCLGGINFFVRYSEVDAGFRLSSFKFPTYIPLNMTITHTHTVIGNIFENRDLIQA